MSDRKRQIPIEEIQLSEQFLIYKNRRSGYVSELAKLITKAKVCRDKKKHSATLFRKTIRKLIRDISH